MTTTEAIIDKDLVNEKVTVTKHFNARPDAVWQAWTKQDILDQWWAPKPWRTETKKLDFKESGAWQYAMLGPDNEKQYGKFSYTKINAPKGFEAIDSFTDEKGFISADHPQLKWKTEFRSAGAGTDVKIIVSSKTEQAVEKILDMGFEEGFKMALNNLEEYLDEQQ